MKAKNIIKVISAITVTAVSAVFVFKHRSGRHGGSIGFDVADKEFEGFLYDEPDNGCIALKR